MAAVHSAVNGGVRVPTWLNASKTNNFMSELTLLSVVSMGKSDSLVRKLNANGKFDSEVL